MPTARIEIGAGTYDYDIDGTPGTVTVPTLTAGSIDQASPSIGDTLTVSGSNASATATFQWQQSADGSTGWTNISGATSTSLDTSSGVTDDYYVRRQTSDGVQGPINTAAVQVSAAATVPDAFVDADWSVATGSGAGELDVTIASLPSDGGATITDIEYELDASGTWVSSGGTTSFTITGLTAATSYDVRLRAVNSVGAGAAGNTESATTGAAPGFTETGVTSVNGSTYLTAGSTVADAPGCLFFASIENAADSRQHLIGVNGANTGFMTDFGGGDSLITPRVTLAGNPSGGVGLQSSLDYSTSERLHILATVAVDGVDQWIDMQIWDSVNGWRSAVSNNSANGVTSVVLSAANWTVFGRGGDPTNQGFDGICYRLAAWTFSNIADVPDITSAAVRDWFASGGSLVDPATSRGNITGTPLIDLSGSVADWNAGTHDGSLTLTSTGNFT